MCTSTVAHEKCGAGAASRAIEDVLVAAARQGNTAAFETMAIRYRRMVMSIIWRMTGNSTEAEDLTQQALMKAFVNLERFAGKCSFSTWLVSIAMNEARMWRRREGRLREVKMSELLTDEDIDCPVEFMDSRPGPDAVYFEAERKRLLLAELERLKPEARLTLQLCDIEERSNIEAARTLGVTESGVKSRRVRARALLRKRLEMKSGGRDGRKGRPAGGKNGPLVQTPPGTAVNFHHVMNGTGASEDKSGSEEIADE